MSKYRLDELLVKKGLVTSREKAKDLILSGRVYIGTIVADKPGKKYSESTEILVKENPYKYVSRGALKLKEVLKKYHPEPLFKKIAMDIGASTGGFTQILLERGAEKVYAIDVGYGQLDWKLRNDYRVINIEKYNARYLKRNEILNENEKVYLITMDVSFISVKKILPVIKREIPECEWLFVLIKPQFEAERKYVKKGVVRDENVIKRIIENIREFCEKLEYEIKGCEPSPIKGPKGNQEYIMVLKK